MAENFYQKRTDIYHIDPRDIVVLSGWNERVEWDLQPLLATMRENGLYGLPPLVITRSKDGVIELRDGERRLRAIRQLIDEGVPVKTVPCVIDIDPTTKRRPSEADMLMRMYLSNTGKPFTAIEEARTFKRLCLWNWTPEDIARRIGKSVGTIRSSLALLDAAPELVTAFQDGTVTKTEAVAVVRQARQTDENQGAVLEARQAVKRERKSEKGARGKLPETLEHWQLQASHLCGVMGAVEMVNAVITYLQTTEHYSDYLQALLDAQDVAAQQHA